MPSFTVRLNDAAPLPDPPVICSHGASVVAVHVDEPSLKLTVARCGPLRRPLVPAIAPNDMLVRLTETRVFAFGPPGSGGGGGSSVVVGVGPGSITSGTGTGFGLGVPLTTTITADFASMNRFETVLFAKTEIW